MRKRLLVLLLALAILPLGAGYAAGPSASGPVFPLPAGDALSTQIKARVTAWPDLAAETLAALQAWLETAHLSIRLERQGEMSLASLADSRGELFAAQTEAPGQQALLTLRVGEGFAPARYLGSPAQPPWQALFPGLPTLPNPGLAVNALTQLAQAALTPLLPYEKPVKRSTSIRNVGKAPLQAVYTLKKSEAQAYWEEASPRLLPLLDSLLAALAPGQAAPVSAALKELQMAGTLTVKRYLTEDGGDLGLQVTGSLQTGGETRKLTLYGGVSQSGLYLSFKLPATRGKDTMELQLSAVFRGEELSGDWKTRLVSGGSTVRTAGEFDLNASSAGAGLAMEGSLEMDYIQSGDVKKSLRYTLTPALLFSGGTLTGTLGILEHAGKRLLRDVQLTFSPPATDLEPLQAQAETDLLVASPQELALIQTRIGGALLPRLKQFLLSLDASTRALVLHDLGRERRTQGESVKPMINTDGLFTVTDHLPDEATKEDTP